MIRVHIRWLIRRDMPEVLAIESGSFSEPWGEDRILRTLRRRNCIGMVAEHRERIVGFMIYELYARRIVVLSFAVHPELRRRHVGAQLVAKLVDKLSRHRRTCLEVALPETNLDGQLFFRSQGFLAEEILRWASGATGEDAYLMRYTLPDLEGVEAERPSRIAKHFEG
jgi:[ribosomal protein S18]-alanine N-acetyltransferase